MYSTDWVRVVDGREIVLKIDTWKNVTKTQKLGFLKSMYQAGHLALNESWKASIRIWPAKPQHVLKDVQDCCGTVNSRLLPKHHFQSDRTSKLTKIRAHHQALELQVQGCKFRAREFNHDSWDVNWSFLMSAFVFFPGKCLLSLLAILLFKLRVAAKLLETIPIQLHGFAHSK